MALRVPCETTTQSLDTRNREKDVAGEIRQMLLMQGFCPKDVDNVPRIGRLARWTPLSCAASGTTGLVFGSSLLPFSVSLCPCVFASAAGLWVGSGWFFISLGLLTLTGGLTNRSIYDRFYNAVIRPLLRTASVPRHGPPRRFGCAIGAMFYIVSGMGFLLNNIWMAFVPAAFMVIFGTIAGLTQWCFASALYGWLFGGNKSDPSGDAVRAVVAYSAENTS